LTRVTINLATPLKAIAELKSTTVAAADAAAAQDARITELAELVQSQQAGGRILLTQHFSLPREG
jgi:hypothetical protein